VNGGKLSMFTYQSYLEAKDRITFQDTEEIYNELRTAANTNNRQFQDLWKDVIQRAIDYVNFRAKYSIQTPNERSEDFDKTRTTKHNMFMYSLQDIVFFMDEQGWQTDWFKKIGTIKDNRKRLGDFACYLVYIYSLNAR